MDEEGGMTLKASARRFEYGTRNSADVAGLGAALEIWENIGWPEVFRGIEAYTDRLKSALSELPGLVLQTPLPYAQSSGIVTFHLPGFEAAAIYQSLLRHERVVLSPTSAVEFGEPGIRVSAHVFNNDDDADRLLSGLRRILANGID
jgi:selenocysteine lyase/cysteine desulfurase